MTYGALILTSDGLQSINDIRGARLVDSYIGSSETGSVTISDFDSTKGEIFPFSLDGLSAPNISFNNSTKLLTWSGSTNTSSRNSKSTEFFFLHVR